jgi:hypothetical protein
MLEKHEKPSNVYGNGDAQCHATKIMTHIQNKGHHVGPHFGS